MDDELQSAIARYLQTHFNTIRKFTMASNQALIFGASGISGWSLMRECLTLSYERDVLEGDWIDQSSIEPKRCDAPR